MGSKPSLGSAKKAEKARKLEKKRLRKGKGKAEQAWYEEKGGDSDEDSSDDDMLDFRGDFGNGGQPSWADDDEDFIAKMQVSLLVFLFLDYMSSLLTSEIVVVL